MNADRQPLDETIRDAVIEHGNTVDTAIPDFDALLSGRQRHTRRLLASATLAVSLVGIGGVVLATSRPQGPSDTVSQSLDEPAASHARSDDTDDTDDTTTTSMLPSPAVVATPAAEPAEYFCTDPLGEDQLGRSLFGSCEPAPDQFDSDYACTDRLGTDGTGRQRFSRCEAVGQLGPIPGDDDDTPFDNPDDIPVRATTYVVQPGDFAIKVADEFCVSVVDLEAANGWTDSSRDFPSPGSEILVPEGFDETQCDTGSYTITSDDTSRIAVADRFCISVQALDAANANTDGYDSFFPGLAIVIPPTSEGTC